MVIGYFILLVINCGSKNNKSHNDKNGTEKVSDEPDDSYSLTGEWVQFTDHDYKYSVSFPKSVEVHETTLNGKKAFEPVIPVEAINELGETTVIDFYFYVMPCQIDKAKEVESVNEQNKKYWLTYRQSQYGTTAFVNMPIDDNSCLNMDIYADFKHGPLFDLYQESEASNFVFNVINSIDY